LVARICIKYPHLTGYETIGKVFEEYSTQSWEKEVTLFDEPATGNENNTSYSMFVQNPVFPYDNNCSMITPHTKMILQDEFTHANSIFNSKKQKTSQKSQSLKFNVMTMNSLLEPLEAQNTFEQYLKINVSTQQVDHYEFLGCLESKLIKLVKVVEAKNTYNQYDPMKLDHLICVRPCLYHYGQKDQVHDLSYSTDSAAEQITKYYFGIFVRGTEASKGKPDPTFDQIKHMMQRAINAFKKDLFENQLQQYHNLLGKKINVRLD